MRRWSGSRDLVRRDDCTRQAANGLCARGRRGAADELELNQQRPRLIERSLQLADAIGGAWNSAASGLDVLPLLEELTRAYCRNPNRLRSVRTLVEQLGGTAQGREVIPAEFLALWKTFDSLLPEAGE